MKGIQSNGFLPIIVQTIAEMEETYGKFSSLDEVNFAKVARDLDICIDTLCDWLKEDGMQLSQVSRHNREQQCIRELEGGNPNPAQASWRKSGKIPLRSGITLPRGHCGAGMSGFGYFTQQLL